MKVVPDAPARAPASTPAASTSRRGPSLVVAGIAVAIVAGVVLRFVTRSDLWLDEALSVNIAKLPLDQLREALRHDGAPPLYYLLLHGWIQVFGSGDVAVRALSGVFSVATLPIAWWCGRRLGGRRLGWVAVLVFASSPYAIRYATESRMYSLQMFLVLAGYLALVRALERPALGRLALVAVIASALMYTQYWSMYLLAVVGIGLVFRAVRAPTLNERRAARSVIVAMIAAGITFLPWLTTFQYQLAHTGTPWGDPILPTSGFADSIIGFGGGGDHAEAFVLLLPVLLLPLLALFGRAVDGRRIELDLHTVHGIRWELAAAIAGLGLGLTVAFVGSTAFEARYAAIAFPLFALAIAFGTLVFADRRLFVGVVAAVTALGLVGGLRAADDQRTQASQSADYIRAHARAGDVVLYCPDQVAPDTSRLLAGGPRLTQFTFPSFDSPRFVDWVDYADRNRHTDPAVFARKTLGRAGHHTIWYVNVEGYRNVVGKCDAVGAALSAARPGAVVRVVPDNDIFEFMGLTEYPAP
jgi:mannosyltransferase